MYVPQYGLTFGYSTLVLALREPLVTTGCAQLQTIPSTSDMIGLMMKNFLRILTILTISPMPTGRGGERWAVGLYDDFSRGLNLLFSTSSL
jgi:hypothetical protein